MIPATACRRFMFRFSLSLQYDAAYRAPGQAVLVPPYLHTNNFQLGVTAAKYDLPRRCCKFSHLCRPIFRGVYQPDGAIVGVVAVDFELQTMDGQRLLFAPAFMCCDSGCCQYFAARRRWVSCLLFTICADRAVIVAQLCVCD